MAKFSQAFLRSMTQPAYQEGLFTAARQLGEMPGRMREAQEVRATQESLVEMMNTNSRIAETGNVKGLEEQRNILTGMLSSATSDTSRDMILGELSRLEGLRDVAKPVARQRDVNTLLRAEKSLKEADDQIASLRADTSPDASIRLDAALRAKQAIQSRINSLRSDATLVTEVDNAKVDMEIAALTKDEALRSARKNDMIARLKSVSVDSNEWKDLVEEAGKQNLGAAVNSVIADLQEAELKRLEVKKAQEEQRPLSDEEINELQEVGLWDDELSPTLSKIEQRRRYTVFANAQIQKKVDIATRPLDVPSEARANALVKTTLSFMAKNSEIEYLPFLQDLSDKLENLLSDPEELQTVQGLVSGLSGIEIRNEILSYIEEKFPSNYAKYQANQKRKAVDQELMDQLVQQQFEKDKTLDPNDELDQIIAQKRADDEVALEAKRVTGAEISEITETGYVPPTFGMY